MTGSITSTLIPENEKNDYGSKYLTKTVKQICDYEKSEKLLEFVLGEGEIFCVQVFEC